MKVSHRDYCEENGDFNRLCRFVSAINAASRAYSAWCVGRIVDWKFGLYENKRLYANFCNENAHLWFDGFDELAGFVISENGGPDFAVLTLPGYRFLYEEMLQWTLETWQDRGPAFNTEVTEAQAIEARALEECGFEKKSAFYTRRFDLTGELTPRAPLEPGFTIVDMHTHPDYRGQRRLRSNAFQGQDSLSDEELKHHLRFFNYGHHGPIYHAPTDLCVMAEDGTLVAGCEALIDAHNCTADIERVCTHSGFRKRGFARAVILECLYRLKDMGIHSAYITGYSPEAIALYGSLGAKDEIRLFEYEKVFSH